MLAFVIIDLAQIVGVHRSSGAPVAIRNSIVQIENNRVRPVPKSVQDWITMVRAEIA
jgi:hypothetical protein